MSTMSAYRIHRFGGPEVFASERIEVPEPGAGEVLVRVRTASANPVDIKTREGKYPLVREDTLGRDFAGVVERVGAGATEWTHGDDVYGFVGQGQGTYAEFVVVDAHALALSPTKVDVTTAGAVPHGKDCSIMVAWKRESACSFMRARVASDTLPCSLRSTKARRFSLRHPATASSWCARLALTM